MFYPTGMRKENIISLLITFFLLSLIVSCAQKPKTKEISNITTEKPTQIESINVISDPSGRSTIIEITSSKRVSYAAFKLAQPLRFIVDFNAPPANELTEPGIIHDSLIKDIHFEKFEDKPQSTRIIATLTQDIEYNANEKNETIAFQLSPKKSIEMVEKQLPSTSAKEEEIEAAKPRLFFSPSKTDLNQILGIDFSMLSNGRSRVTVTTTKRAEYDLSQKDSLTLLLEITGVIIPSELTRYVNSSLFKGAVNRIKPIVKSAEKQVDLEIELKEMVPYHVVQTDEEIRLDFYKTSVEPPVKKITRSKLEELAQKSTDESHEGDHSTPANDITAIDSSHKQSKQYTGDKVTLDFSNADIRNILKLIGEVSNLNIIWGSDVKGTASMRLKNVPWDQALDILLETNNLGMRRDRDVIWITTKTKIKELEKEEEEKRKAKYDRLKEKLDEQKAAQALEPLVTEKISVDFKDAKEIKGLIILSERGTINVFGNSLIITDIASSIEKAREQVKKIDTPPIQVMIEARLVDASEDFSRDLGVRWNSIDRQWRKRIGMDWMTPEDRIDGTTFGHYEDQYLDSGFISSNPPTGWVPNIGLRFATLTNKGLGTLALDASLALGESEGDVKIISAPKVIASNGEEAEISRGDVIYRDIVTTDTIEVEELEALLLLKVTPTVKANNYVTMDIEVNDDQVYADQTGKTEKYIKTKLMVRTGNTVVIGGIFKEEKGGAETGIPGLRSIPFLGWLFKAQTKSRVRSELLIFLTPTVLSDLDTSQK